MGQKGSGLQFITVIIGLITAVIVLLHTLTNIDACAILKNIVKPEKTNNDNPIELLNESIKALKLTIISPGNGTVVTDPNITIKGTIEGNLPDGLRVYVLLKDQHNYFLQYPAVEVSGAQNEWSHNNVQFASNGKWRVVICLANKEGTSHFEKLARENNWSGFPGLPDGTKIIKQIHVTKK